MNKPFNFVIKVKRKDGAFTYLNPEHIARFEIRKLPESYLKVIMSDGIGFEFKGQEAVQLIGRIESGERLFKGE